MATEATTASATPAVATPAPIAATPKPRKGSFTRSLGLETGATTKSSASADIARPGTEAAVVTATAAPATTTTTTEATPTAPAATTTTPAAVTAIETQVAEAPAAATTEAPKAAEAAPEASKADEKVTEETAEKAEEAPAAEAPKLDIATYQQEYDTNGKLSDASYADISAKTGLDRSTIDSVVVALKARQDTLTAHWTDMMGGETTKKQITEWARTNWSPEQKAAYNKIVDGNDTNAIDLAVQGMVSAYRAAGGTFEPKTTVTVTTPTTGSPTAGYASEAAYREDVRSLKYKKDAAFRTAVQAKLAASSFFKKA